MSDEQTREEVTPTPEPDSEPSDPHQGPLDDWEDARFLDPIDPRRIAAEHKRGGRFED
jgi:hypothetical protein